MDTPRTHSTVKADPDPVLEALREACADEGKAVALFELMRWPDGKADCPKCSAPDTYAMQAKGGGREKNYRWRCRKCGQMFSVRTGSVFEETRVPLHKWARAYWLGVSSKKGVSALQVSRECAVSYKTALFLMHRIRYAMDAGDEAPKLAGVLEADETYVGGKPRRNDDPPAAYSRAEKQDGTRRRWLKSKKVPVLVLVQRGGDARFAVTERVTAKRVGAFLAKHADLKATLNTDESPVYTGVGKRFSGGHNTVNHSAFEYARPDGSHSNTAESVFSRLKRGLYGVWHSVSKHHLHRYLANVAFLHNTRKMDDSGRFAAAVRGGIGKRLLYRNPDAQTA